jgi:cell pole-organizing protein PopZ
MSSTERAPEPTMEEILASIRRIISDDEANTSQRTTSSDYANHARADEAEYGSADTQMIEHLERALGGVAGPAANDDGVDDILDLTDPGASPEDALMADEPVVLIEDEPIALVEEVVLETEVHVESRPRVDFGAAFPPAGPARNGLAEGGNAAAGSFSAPEPSYPEPTYPEPTYEDPAPSFSAEEAPSFAEETPVVAEAPANEPMANEIAGEPPISAQPAPAPDDPATALERAIAALKAGDLAAFAREAQAGSQAPEPVYVPPASIYAEPARETQAAPDTAPAPEAPSFEPEPFTVEDEDAAGAAGSEPAAFEPETPSWSAETPSWSDRSEEARAESEEEPEPEMDFASDPAPWRNEGMAWRGSPPANEFELNPARVNGGRDHQPQDYAVPGSKTLEDSVKEMLRPMLKQWLDENMPRVLTAALREELEGSDSQRRGS